jgi:hypothetical protein
VPPTITVDAPKEHPDWRELVTSGLDVQLLTLNGLERGELIQFRSAHHQIDVSADQTGRDTDCRQLGAWQRGPCRIDLSREPLARRRPFTRRVFL